MKRGTGLVKPLVIPPAPRKPEALPLAESVTIIIIGYNLDPQHLRECLASVQAQTRQPDELLYVDDSSENDSLALAAGMGIATARTEQRGGMCAPRMVGVSLTSAELILFVDGDDVLPPTYLADLLSAMGGHDIAYPAAFRCFGDPERVAARTRNAEGLLRFPAPDRRALWQRNHVSTCSLWRRSALLAVGGWRETPSGTMADWDLALRITGNGGSYVRSEAVLGYRLHADNWTVQPRESTQAERNGKVRRHAATLTVGCIYSGRLPDLFAEWLEAVAKALVCAGKTAELIILDDSADGLDPALITKHQSLITAVTIKRLRSGETTATRRANSVATCQFMAAQCNELLKRCTTDLLWIIEDDTIVPDTALDDLLHMQLQGTATLPAVCGVYRNRHRPDCYVAADFVNGQVQRWTSLPARPTPVQLTGTGCLLIHRDSVPIGLRFEGELLAHGRRIPSHDWAFSHRLHQLGCPVLLLPSVLCRHYTTAEEWV